MIAKGVIKYAEHEKWEFITPIFFHSKVDGTSRIVFEKASWIFGIHNF